MLLPPAHRASLCAGILRFLEFHGHRHPRQLAEDDVNRFLTDLAVRQQVSASTHNQALSAILFLYKPVLKQPLDRIDGVVRARRPKRLPVVLTVDEVSRVLAHLRGDKWLIGLLLYGGGLRLLEALRLRVKDLDFQRGEITVREGKGDNDRLTMLPQAVIAPLRAHLRRVQVIFQQDLAQGYGRAELPHALARKYPNANRQWCWHFAFLQKGRWRNPKTGEQGRRRIDASSFQRALKFAVHKAGLTKRVTSHTFRHSFATHLLPLPLGEGRGEGPLRNSDGSRTAGPQGRAHDDDVHPRSERGGRGVRTPADTLPRPDAC